MVDSANQRVIVLKEIKSMGNVIIIKNINGDICKYAEECLKKGIKMEKL